MELQLSLLLDNTLINGEGGHILDLKKNKHMISSASCGSSGGNGGNGIKPEWKETGEPNGGYDSQDWHHYSIW